MDLPNLPILAALGQRTRWRTFELLLAHGDRGMLQGEIAKALEVEKNLLSVHLRVLKEAGLVSAEKHGREITYRVTPAGAQKTVEKVLDAIRERKRS
ncbi:ArsR family transcriptional regulator [Sphingomonas sp. ABOLE]|uniref:ArsR/SmtB family transcription factor n=1 Tax=Sphingomonas sp. ABOLE TaxID=1985878 RepID=UPI000F7F5B92|nr:metalloregulator ArsR/SmtB family transcription factor [Sphingomonas sp. ABOLE]RSV41104.1 ArsR family transcriptional regulator [Sphingomonas sp. ABOLE]